MQRRYTMQQEVVHAGKPWSCRPCTSRMRPPRAGAGNPHQSGSGNWGSGMRTQAGTCGYRWKSRVPLRRQKKQRHVPMVPVLDGGEAKCRGEGRSSEKHWTLGSEGENERKEESAILMSSLAATTCRPCRRARPSAVSHRVVGALRRARAWPRARAPPRWLSPRRRGAPWTKGALCGAPSRLRPRGGRSVEEGWLLES